MHTSEQAFQLDVDNFLYRVEIQLIESDDFVQTIQKLGSKLFAQALLDDGTSTLLVAFTLRKTVQACCLEADTLSELLQLSCSGI